MENNNPITAKVYSNDNKLWLKMTRDEAYSCGKETLELFNYADKDGNLEISQKELNRYNSPVIIENYEKVENSRIVTNGTVKNPSLFVEEADYSSVSHTIISSEEEFFAGLTLQEVSKEGTAIFYAIDTDHDKVISADEITQASEIKTRISNAQQELENGIKKKSKKWLRNSTLIGAGVGLACIPVFIYLSGAIMSSIAVGAFIGGLAGVLGRAAGEFLFCYNKLKKYINENSEQIYNNQLAELKDAPYAQLLKRKYYENMINAE